jgi:hypothetical protein
MEQNHNKKAILWPDWDPKMKRGILGEPQALSGVRVGGQQDSNEEAFSTQTGVPFEVFMEELGQDNGHDDEQDELA